MPSCSKAFDYVDYVRAGGDVAWDFFGWLCERTYARASAARANVVIVSREDDSILFRVVRHVRPAVHHRECCPWCDYEIVGTHTRDRLLRRYEVESVRQLLAASGRVDYFDVYEPT